MHSLINNTRKPDITFCRDGRILICARISRILGLSSGDSINIALKTSPLAKTEYLLFAKRNSVGRHEAQCYPTKQGSHNFCANSVRLARAMLDACKINSFKASFMAGSPIIVNNITYIPIITARPLGFCPEGVA